MTDSPVALHEAQVAQLNRYTRRASPAIVIVPVDEPEMVPGARVVVTRGGFRGNEGTVRRIDFCPDRETPLVVIVSLDDGLDFIGSKHCLKVCA